MDYTQNESASLMRKFSLFLYAHSDDLCPHLVAAAMVCGFSVVYSNSGGAPELGRCRDWCKPGIGRVRAAPARRSSAAFEVAGSAGLLISGRKWNGLRRMLIGACRVSAMYTEAGKPPRDDFVHGKNRRIVL